MEGVDICIQNGMTTEILKSVAVKRSRDVVPWNEPIGWIARAERGVKWGQASQVSPRKILFSEQLPGSINILIPPYDTDN
jgi:hypothetical protein